MMNCKEYRRKGSWFALRYYLRIFLEGIRKMIRTSDRTAISE
jgi:hypothetical protein